MFKPFYFRNTEVNEVQLVQQMANYSGAVP